MKEKDEFEEDEEEETAWNMSIMEFILVVTLRFSEMKCLIAVCTVLLVWWRGCCNIGFPPN